MTFEKFCHKYRTPVYSYLLKVTQEPALADDLTQETFLKACRFFKQFDPLKASESTWVHTIAKHAFIDYVRGKGAFPLSEEEYRELILNPDPSPEERICRRQERKKLMKLLRPLTKQQKRVLWASCFYGMTAPEVSEKLGLTISSIKNLKLRAKIRLTTIQEGGNSNGNQEEDREGEEAG